MGRKMTWETAEKMRLSNDNDSILAKPNKYGYQINVNHPKIRSLYERYKQKYGIMIPSDRERLAFEKIIFKLIERSSHEQRNTDGAADR